MIVRRSLAACFTRMSYQVMWAFSIFLEAVAIVPQLFMVSKTGEAENITSHYLFALGSYRAMYLLNWIYRYFEVRACLPFVFGAPLTAICTSLLSPSERHQISIYLSGWSS